MIDKYEIAVLAEDYAAKRNRYQQLGLCNTWGLSAEDRMKLDIDYQIADAECIQAYIALETAKMR